MVTMAADANPRRVDPAGVIGTYDVPMTRSETGSMRHWAETAESIRATRATSEKSAIVAEYLCRMKIAIEPALATALYAGQAGLDCTCFLSHQDRSARTAQS